MSQTYSPDEVEAWLDANLPTWRLEQGFLVRTYTTPGWPVTLLLANAIGYLAEAAWHHPELTLHYSRLRVRLQTHEAGGITDKDLELARRIEAVVTWKPAPDDALTGISAPWVE
ncbi:MAG: 4a-hydroxytetrahydrobiopterin dehydratase [Chloroflexi bacterium]|nr:MAG: 4a-hydroxytetrahydrobiopterin dehydratase [Chloroflexota bacterium]